MVDVVVGQRECGGGYGVQGVCRCTESGIEKSRGDNAVEALLGAYRCVKVGARDNSVHGSQ